MALESDQFHEIFTEYFPYGEDTVLYFEERDFYRRFPNSVGMREPSPTGQSDSVTVPGKSGVSVKIADEEKSGDEAAKKGPHMSAVKGTKEDVANEAQVKADSADPEQRDAAIIKAKKDKAAREQEKAGKSGQKEEPKEEFKEEPRKPAVSAAPALDVSQVHEGDDPVVHELIKVFNGLITAIGADDQAGKYTGPVTDAENEIRKIGEKIVAIRTESRNAAQEEINQVHSTFDESARELIRRFEQVRASDAAQFREEYEAEREKLVRSYQDKVSTELTRAEELAEQRLRNELVEQAIEMNRKYVHNVQDLVERERGGRLSKLNELTADVGELEKLLAAWQEVINTNLKTQQLQVAVDSVRTVLERSDMPRPFIRELVAVKELAAEDPVVEAAIASINPTAYQRGIPSTSQLIDRFRRVAGEVRKASLLPENAGIASHAASVVLSKVMFRKDGLASGDHVESVLTRTESLLEEGNLDGAAREVNTLQGWAKILSKDWLADVRRVLEVKQALEVSLSLDFFIYKLVIVAN